MPQWEIRDAVGVVVDVRRDGKEVDVMVAKGRIETYTRRLITETYTKDTYYWWFKKGEPKSNRYASARLVDPDKAKEQINEYHHADIEATLVSLLEEAE